MMRDITLHLSLQLSSVYFRKYTKVFRTSFLHQLVCNILSVKRGESRVQNTIETNGSSHIGRGNLSNDGNME